MEFLPGHIKYSLLIVTHYLEGGIKFPRIFYPPPVLCRKGGAAPPFPPLEETLGMPRLVLKLLYSLQRFRGFC